VCISSRGTSFDKNDTGPRFGELVGCYQPAGSSADYEVVGGSEDGGAGGDRSWTSCSGGRGGSGNGGGGRLGGGVEPGLILAEFCGSEYHSVLAHTIVMVRDYGVFVGWVSDGVE
jgi:hypothetical protein